MRMLMCACSLLLLSSLMPAFAQDAKQRPFFDPLPSKLWAVKALSNHSRGFGGSNDFYQLSKEFMRKRTVKDFELMLHDRNRIVKAMALLCLAQVDAEQYYRTLLAHIKDKEEVYLHEGCVVSRITVGEFTQRLLINPYFLDPDGKRPSVQAPPNNGTAADARMSIILMQELSL